MRTKIFIFILTLFVIGLFYIPQDEPKHSELDKYNTPTSSAVKEVFNTTRTGEMFEDEIWSGTVYLTGDFHIPEGITLIIKPGTKVLVKANYDDQNNGGEHIIDELTNKDPSATPEYTQTHTCFGISGKLIAVGTMEEKIIFTSDAEKPCHSDWDGITFEPASSGEMKYCIVEWTHTGPAIHGTNEINITHCEIKHTFWGGLHAFESSPTFEYNILDDIGHEAFDTHKASPIIRFNNVTHARVAVVFNNYNTETGKPIIFENNTIINCSHVAQLQENAKAIIKNNKFIGSNNTGGPWHYKGFYLRSQEHSQGIALADNVDVEIINNEFINLNEVLFYENIGPNEGIGHTTNIPEPFEIGKNPIKILIKNNYFSKEDKNYLENLEHAHHAIATT